MADRQVKVEFIGDAGSLKGATDEASKAVQKLADSYENGEINATKFVDEVGKISPELGRMAAAGKLAEDAINRLEDAANKGPRALNREIALSVVAVENLKASIAKAQAAGAPVSPDAAAKVAQLQEKIEAAGVASRKTADALGDLKTRGDLTAKGFEQVAGSAGSLEGMLARFKDTGGAAREALANVGFAAVAGAAAFGMGYQAGVKLREIYLDLTGKQMPNLTNQFVQLITGIKGANDAFDKHGVAAKSLVGQHNALKLAIMASADEMRKSIPEYDAALKKIEEQNAGIGAFKKGLDLIVKTGGDYHEWLKKLPPAMGAWAVEIVKNDDALGKLTGRTRDAVLELARHELATRKHIEALDAQRKAYDRAIDSAVKQVIAEAAGVAAAQASADAARENAEKKMKALKEEDISLEEFSKRKKEIYAEQDRIVAESAKKEEEAAQREKQALLEAKDAVDKKTEGMKENVKVETAATATSKGFIEALQAVAEEYKKGGEAVKTYGTSMATAEEKAAQLEHRHKLAKLQMQELLETFEDGTGKIHFMNEAVENLDRNFQRLTG